VRIVPVTHFALSFALLGLLPMAPPCRAQGNLPGLRRSHRQPFSASQAAAQAAEAVPAGSPTYTFTLINFPGAPDTLAEAINSGAKASDEQIVGAYGPGVQDLGGDGFLLRIKRSTGAVSETFQTVDFSGGSTQTAGGVNDSGQIVGHYSDSLGVFHGYELSGGTYTTINVSFSGAVDTFPYGIDNAGDIVGCWSRSGNTAGGFELSGGTYTQLQFPGGTGTCGHAINNKGDITGYYDDTSGAHGFVLSAGIYTSIDVPGAVETIAGGINDAGDIVGTYCTTSACIAALDGAQGFLLSKGVFSTINVPGASATAPISISDKGILVGWYADCAGITHSFIATP